MNANDRKCSNKVHKSFSLVLKVKVDRKNNKTNLHISLPWFHVCMTGLKSLQTNSLTHIAYSTFYIDITYFHIFFTYLHILQLLCGHTHTHWTFENRIFIIYDLMQVLDHFFSCINMTHLHCCREFIFTFSHIFTTAHWIYIHLCAMHIYLYIYMIHWQACKQIEICTFTLHPHMHLCMHTYITHCELTLQIYNLIFHITSPCVIDISHVKHSCMIHTLTQLAHMFLSSHVHDLVICPT